MKKGKSRLAALALTGILCFAGFADFMPITAQAQESAVSGTVIDVTDYGAQANNGYDNAEAIAKAIQAAKEASKNGGEKTRNN